MILGASGYIGRHLVPSLIEKGYRVRGLTRDREKAAELSGLGAEPFEGDLLELSTLPRAFDGAEVVYYLVHSLRAGEDRFAVNDRQAAENAVWMADYFGIKRIIYLGALGRRTKALSPHLISRHQVGDILRKSKAAVTEFRAAIVIGAEGASFRIIYYLVKRFPVMVCPLRTLVGTQPIALDDAIRYLSDSIEKPESEGKVLDIGGPDIVTYGDMMSAVANELGVKRQMIFMPSLAPRLSSRWISLLTPVPATIARPLLEGLRYRTICENTDALRIFNFAPMGLDEAMRIAVSQIKEMEKPKQAPAETTRSQDISEPQEISLV